MKRVKYFFAAVSSYLFVFASLAQSPVADFTISSEVCIEEQLQIDNLSQSATSFEWDFCEGDLSNAPLAGNITFLPGSFNPKDVTLIKDDNDFWFGFVAVRSTNELYRLNFGPDASNMTPQVDNLGSLNGALVNPEQVEFRKENGSYYGFVLNGGNQTLLRLSFGNSLMNVPQAETIYNSIGTVNGGMDIAKSSGQWYAVFSHSTNRTLQVLRIGTGLDSNPGIADFIETPVIPGLIGADPIAIAEELGMWYVFVGGSSSRTIHRVSFGSTLFNANPSSVIINSSSIGSSRPAGIEIARDKGDFVLLIQLLDGIVQTWNLGGSPENDVQQVNDFGNLGLLNNADCIELVKDESEYTAFTMNSATRFIQSYTFPDNCFSNVSFTTNPIPSSVYYQQGGSFWMSLTARNDEGESYKANQVNVKNSLAPMAGFNAVGNCAGSGISFLPDEGNPSSSYLWNFGDGSQSSEIIPQHIYDSPGDYLVTVDIESADGCRNSSRKLISVFTEPIADFTNPAVACSNSPLFFQNLNDTDYGGIATYSWTVDGDIVSQDRDLVYTFANEGDFEVSLIIEIPGCFDQQTKLITIQPGPKPSFIVSDACVGTDLQFTNTSTGSITASFWDFGDGTTSTISDPVYRYDEPGDYNVSLTVFNEAGCESVFSQLVTVFAQPEASFSTELACAGNPVQFIDESFVQNANIEAWAWEFGNGNVSNEKDPEFAFQSAGVFPVSLTVTSTFGCEATVIQEVEVLPSPIADFTFTTACIGETVEFTDTSIPPSGETITSWAWNIGGAFSSQRNPSYSFEFATDYNVSLFVVASNQCIGGKEAVVSVPVPPEPDFEVFGNCAGNEALFTDNTTSSGDPVVRWSWDFGGLGIAEGEQATFRFPATGTYTVTLDVETQQGCTYSTSRQVNVGEPPVAGFEASTIAGPPPLEVVFTNTSLEADSFEWRIDEQSVSNDRDLTYVFDELGEYKVELRVLNEDGCPDVFSRTVSAVIPQVDLSAENLLGIRSNGKMNLQMRLSNLGTITVDRVPLRLLLESGVVISDEIEVNLAPGSSGTYRLPFELEDREFQFICIEIEDMISGFPDIDLSNNSACTTFGRGGVVSRPFPNPVADEVHLNIYNEGTGDFSVEIINEAGQIVSAPVFRTDRAGITTVTINTSMLRSGVYLLRLSEGGRQTVHRIVVQH